MIFQTSWFVMSNGGWPGPGGVIASLMQQAWMQQAWNYHAAALELLFQNFLTAADVETYDIFKTPTRGVSDVDFRAACREMKLRNRVGVVTGSGSRIARAALPAGDA